MTRKDYVAIAAALKAARMNTYTSGAVVQTHLHAVNSTAAQIADVMARDNPRFDRGRFLKACGVQS